MPRSPRYASLVLVLLLGSCTSEAGSDRLRLVGGSFSPCGNTPGSNVTFLSFPSQKSAQDPGDWGPLLTDIESHLPASYGNQYYDAAKMTHGHETTHGINAHVRNTLNSTGTKANGFYVLDDRALIITEPTMSKSAVAAFVPSSLRGYRFSLYITGQTAWDDTPLYVFDEWVAYTNGAAVGVDLVQRGLWKEPWTDGVSGALEFTIYSLALCLAVEKNDPQYLAQNTQFKEFVAWQARRAMQIYRAGATTSAFKWGDQDKMLQTLQTAPEAAALRGMLVKLFGQAFADEVLGLSSGTSPGADLGPTPPPKPDLGLPSKPDLGAPALPPHVAPDTQPPTVTILSPTNGWSVPSSVVLTATITDNVGVARAELLLDGKPLSLRTVPPYEFPLQLGAGHHVLRVAATDAAGNRGEASVGVKVEADAQPPVSGAVFGASCAAAADCQSGLCAEDLTVGLKYCTQSCGAGGVCPSGSCLQASNAAMQICGPPELPTIPQAQGASRPTGRMGCAMARTADVNPESTLIPLLCLALFSLVCATRARAARAAATGAPARWSARRRADTSSRCRR